MLEGEEKNNLMMADIRESVKNGGKKPTLGELRAMGSSVKRFLMVVT